MLDTTLVAQIAITLRTLASAARPDTLRSAGKARLLVCRLYYSPATSRSEVWIHDGAVAPQYLDPYNDFLVALKGISATRVRQCSVCNHFFFALREDQKACSKRCNAVRRVREWRANQAGHEYRRKLREAGLLTPARKKGRSGRGRR